MSTCTCEVTVVHDINSINSTISFALLECFRSPVGLKDLRDLARLILEINSYLTR